MTFEHGEYGVPIYRCWWSQGLARRGCTDLNPNSDKLDFNTYGWLYLGGAVLIMFAVFGLVALICKTGGKKEESKKDIIV